MPAACSVVGDVVVAPTGLGSRARRAPALRGRRLRDPPRRTSGVVRERDPATGPMTEQFILKRPEGEHVASSVEPQNTAQTKQRLEQALFEIRRVIAGQDQMLERVLDLPADRRPPPDRGRPGACEDAHGEDDRRRARRDVQPHPVHARPRPVRSRSARGSTAPTTRRFDTELGPVFCNFLLADEINRAPAKVQSALLEVMQERQVTLGHTTHPVPGSVPRDGDAEPDRVGGHLPAARGAGRPLHAQDPRRLSAARRGADGDPALARGAARAQRSCSRSTSSARVQAAVREIYVDPGPRQLRAPARDRDAPPGRVRAARSGALHLVRRQPARADLA